MYKLNFFKKANGDRPFRTFLNGLNEETRAKFIRLMDIFVEHGTRLGKPYSNPLRDGIRELRIEVGLYQYHALYFLQVAKTYTFTHGIITRADSVPDVEIERAIRCRREHLGQID